MGKKVRNKKIILSYDYELFFGERSGTVQKTLIEPSQRLMDTMEECGFRGTFFIDVLMIKCLRLNEDYQSVEDLHLIEDQLRDMVKRGHRIELHLHPHWVDAKYNGDGTWDFHDYHHYMLSTFSEDEIVNMFTEGAEYLNSIASEVVPGYKVCAFRAGGWAIQPFEKLKKAFLSAGIMVDSSCAYGMHSSLPDSFFDFRGIPSKEPYRFEDDVLKEENHGPFIEVPITTYNLSLKYYIARLIFHKLYRINVSSITDGSHFRAELQELEVRPPRMDRLIHSKNYFTLFSLSQYHYKFVKYVLQRLNSDVVCLIDHPKDFSDSTCRGIKEMKGLVESISYLDVCKGY